MPDQPNTKAQIRSILEELFVIPPEMADEELTAENLGPDSLDQVELLLALEDSYDMDIPDEDIKSDWTLDSLVEYVDRRRDQTLLS
jgi:acyl carrier protein